MAVVLTAVVANVAGWLASLAHSRISVRSKSCAKSSGSQWLHLAQGQGTTTTLGEREKLAGTRSRRELGRGAMGVVYHAIDPDYRPPGRDQDTAASRTGRWRGALRRLRERLFREARSAGALSHPGIVTIYDMDEVDGLAYIAMEFVDGDTLEEICCRSPQGLSAGSA